MTDVVAEIDTPEALAPTTRKFARAEQLHEWSRHNFAPRILWLGEGVTQEDLRFHEFWKQLVQAHRFQPFDQIECRSHDRTWKALVTVWAVDRNGLDVGFDSVKSHKREIPADDDDGIYTIRDAGGAMPFQIVRNADQHIMASYGNREQARFERARLHPKSAAA